MAAASKSMPPMIVHRLDASKTEPVKPRSEAIGRTHTGAQAAQPTPTMGSTVAAAAANTPSIDVPISNRRCLLTV
jgi:hypothetical protein